MLPKPADPLADCLKCWHKEDLHALRGTVQRCMAGEEAERMEQAITDELNRRRKIN